MQKHSSSEQRYLLRRLAKIFPDLISMMTFESQPKRDFMFRNYPFVLSKGIYLGFKYLCPGNHSLFKGGFQRILYLSVFRLLTGVDICPGSIDSLRLKIYPIDSNDDSNEKSKNEKNCSNKYLQHHSSKKEAYHFDSINVPKECTPSCPRHNKFIIRNSKQKVSTFSEEKNHDNDYSQKDHHKSFEMTSVGKSNVLYTKFADKLLPRQQQVNFDVNQISPLLQQCLGREGIDLRKKIMVTRTEPVNYCKRGGINTFRSKCKMLHEDDQERESILQIHTKSTNDFQSLALQSKRRLKVQLKCIKTESSRGATTVEDRHCSP